MNQNSRIHKILTVIILVLLSLSISSNADSNKSDIHEIDDGESYMNTSYTLPDYGPEMFEKAENEANFIAARGTMPVITSEVEKREWTDLLVKCTRSNSEILEYFLVNGGPIISFGSNIDGYLKVGMESNTPEKVNNTVVNEIYEVISRQCEKEGVNEVPVVFVWEHEEEILEEEFPPTSVDALENKSTQAENKSSRSISGFTSIMLVLCLLILLKYRK
ncbi:hypothetical protein [Methanolobus sp. WCC4]|uniref:hypothetical protein n=1 Tax=Methanolobus sp. WCC4 TaxID=3125784 RepID=UPI0030F6D765